MFNKKKKSGKIPLMKVAKAKRGNTLQTRDEYLAGQKGKNIKPKHPNKNDLYRTGVIIRVNNQDEYAIVPLTTKKKIKLDEYYDKKIFEQDPFARIDENGVGQLVKMGVEKGRSVKPNLKAGICGEHGGEPSSIDFCHRVGLSYVSCSPYRIPIAILAAAQSAIKNK